MVQSQLVVEPNLSAWWTFRIALKQLLTVSIPSAVSIYNSPTLQASRMQSPSLHSSFASQPMAITKLEFWRLQQLVPISDDELADIVKIHANFQFNEESITHNDDGFVEERDISDAVQILTEAYLHQAGVSKGFTIQTKEGNNISEVAEAASDTQPSDMMHLPTAKLAVPRCPTYSLGLISFIHNGMNLYGIRIGLNVRELTNDKCSRFLEVWAILTLANDAAESPV